MEENNSTYLELALKIRDIPFKRGKVASVISILIPFKDSDAYSISSKCRITGLSAGGVNCKTQLPSSGAHTQKKLFCYLHGSHIGILLLLTHLAFICSTFIYSQAPAEIPTHFSTLH